MPLHPAPAPSTGMFIAKGHDDVVAAIEARVAAVTHLPVDNQEALQVLRWVAVIHFV